MVAVPTVFISSTYYDLRHVRMTIRDFIESLGFRAVLSEQFDVFFQHGESVQTSCLHEVKKCDMYILIIGTRYGSIFPNDTLSITHREYREAITAKLPIYAFVDKYAYDDYRIYCSNKGNSKVDVSKLEYFSVRDTQIFDLIEEVENRATDNALICFDHSAEIIDFLRKQVAGMVSEMLEMKKRKLEALTRTEKEGFDEERVFGDHHYKTTISDGKDGKDKEEGRGKTSEESEKIANDKWDIEREKASKQTIGGAQYSNIIENLNIVGIPSDTISINDIQENENLLELLRSKAEQIDDLDSMFRISMFGSTVYIGKEIINFLSSQYQQLKGGG